MAKITYTDKVAGSTFSHEDANEIKTSVNAAYDGLDLKVDKVTGERLINAAEILKLASDAIAPATNTADYIPQWSGADSKTLKNGLPVPAGGLAGLTALGLKEDKVEGKGLSTNDLTNLLKAAIDFSTVVTIPYTTEIPFTRALTIITGKTLASNDTLTIAANPVEGGGVQTWLIGNGTNEPVLTAFDRIAGSYDKTAGMKNKITMEYIGGEAEISILNMTAI